MKKNYWLKYCGGFLFCAGVALIFMSFFYDVLVNNGSTEASGVIENSGSDFHAIISRQIFFSGIALVLTGLAVSYFKKGFKKSQHGSKNPPVLQSESR